MDIRLCSSRRREPPSRKTRSSRTCRELGPFSRVATAAPQPGCFFNLRRPRGQLQATEHGDCVPNSASTSPTRRSVVAARLTGNGDVRWRLSARQGVLTTSAVNASTIRRYSGPSRSLVVGIASTSLVSMQWAQATVPGRLAGSSAGAVDARRSASLQFTEIFSA
jgi:hypothetical protein